MLENKINGKIYIGLTTRSIEKRLEEHRTGRSIACRAIYNAIKFHGWENFETDWYECPDEDLNFDEELLVREMETLAPRGYNLREGGGGNGKMSEETKQKCSEAKRGENNYWYGKTHGYNTKQKMSKSQCGRTHTDESKQKMSELRLGKPHGEETKQKMSEAQQGEKNHNSKRVYQYALDGTFINSFSSSGEAGRRLKKYAANIRACAHDSDKHKTAYGFKWSYDPPSN